MAPLLSRLFNNRKRCLKDSPSFELTPDFKKWYPPDFNSQSQVRVLLFRDCDNRGRKLLFDSSSIKKKQPPDETTSPKRPTKLPNVKLFSGGKSTPKTTSPPPKTPPPVYVEALKNGETYEYLPKMADVANFGEMMFGSVALSTQGTTKVHIMKSPPSMMITIVFPQMPSEPRTEMVSPTSSLHNSTSEICISKNFSESLNLAHSVPMDVPVALHRTRTLTTDSLQSQLNVSVDSCTSSSLPRSSSFTNLQRRMLRNMSTSIELNLQKRSNSGERLKGKKKLTLGLGVIISLSEVNPDHARKLQSFFFSHILLIENHVLRLKQTIEDNFYHPISLTPFIYQGVIDLQRSIQDLVTAPRLTSPAWLGILSSPTSNLCSKFVSEFVSLLHEFDTKNTNFFVSTLLSVVLSNHLSWVTTVVPSSVLHSRTSYQRPPHKAEWIDSLAKSHPYNPLWMQLADLYGAVGSPFKITQTVVVGSNKELIQRFLFLLSYFIRCSDLCEKVYQLEMTPVQDKSLICCSAPTSSINTNEKKTPLPTKYKNLDDWDVNGVYFPKPPLETAVDFQLGESPADFKTAPFINNNVHNIVRNGLDEQLLEDTILIEQRLEKVEEEEPSSIPEETSQVPNSLSVADQGRLYIQEYQSLRFAPERCTSGLSPTHPPLPEPKEQSEVVPNGIAAILLNKRPEEKQDNNGSPREDSSEEGYHSLEDSKKPSSPVKVQSLLAPGRSLGELMAKQTVPMKAIDLGYTKLIEKETRLDMDLCETLGWSLMASVTDHFLTDFCLQGVHIQSPYSCDLIQKNLVNNMSSSFLGEPIDEAVCIVADVDNWQVNLLSSQRCGGLDVMMSPLVANICDSVLQMRLLNIESDICIMHLEDKLQELFNLSETLMECVDQQQDLHHIVSVLNLEWADLPLLFSTASCHNLISMDSSSL